MQQLSVWPVRKSKSEKWFWFKLSILWTFLRTHDGVYFVCDIYHCVKWDPTCCFSPPPGVFLTSRGWDFISRGSSGSLLRRHDTVEWGSKFVDCLGLIVDRQCQSQWGQTASHDEKSHKTILCVDLWNMWTAKKTRHSQCLWLLRSGGGVEVEQQQLWFLFSGNVIIFKYTQIWTLLSDELKSGQKIIYDLPEHWIVAVWSTILLTWSQFSTIVEQWRRQGKEQGIVHLRSTTRGGFFNSELVWCTLECVLE